jgi:hypothetical protein
VRVPIPAARRFRGAAKCLRRPLQLDDTTVRDLVAHAANPAILSFAAGTPALEYFPIEAFKHAIDSILVT